MKLITRKTKSQAPLDTHSRSEEKFNDAWQRIMRQQNKNDRLRADAQAFAHDIQSGIQDKEKAYMEAIYFSSQHLLSFFRRTSLAQWERAELLEWAVEYLNAMTNNPFSQHLDIFALQQQVEEAYAFAYPESQSLHDPSDDDSAFDDEEHDDSDDEEPSVEDMYEEHESFFDDFFRQQQHAQQQRVQDENLALKHLIRSSSINQLFRKLASILHPDKERDEAARAEKNRLMGELIQARDSNDIPKLFSFYAEYVGDSPLQELGGDLDGATVLLEQHLRYLLDQKEDILDENPLTGALYRQFYKSTPAARQHAVNKHLEDIQTRTEALSDMCDRITSVKSLKPYLKLRRDALFDEDVIDFA